MSLLVSAAEELSNTDALVLALQQVTADLGGLGGLVHRCAQGSDFLRLVAVSGLTSEIAKAWDMVRVDEDVAPALAVDRGGYVWLAEDSLGIGASGVVSVPLPGSEGPVGVLSVITAQLREPDHAKRFFLHSVAAWASDLWGGIPGDATTDTKFAPDQAVRAFRDMSDGLLTVDDDWRITFINKEAERILGAGRASLGSLLWEVAASQAHGFEGQCRRVGAEGRSISFDVRWPTDQRLYQVRLVPVKSGGLTVSFVDVTDQRLSEAGRTTAERIAAERTARMGELAVALAESVTSRDVVKAVEKHVMPAFGADGLLVVALERGVGRLVGTVGYPQEFLSRLDESSAEGNAVLSDAFRNRIPIFIGSRSELIENYPDAEYHLAVSPMHAVAFLPLVVSGHAIGSCAISFARPRSFSDEERTLLTALSALVAQALGRARLYDVEHARAQELQRGLLPRTLPSLPAVSAAARYLPAGKGDEVGGDWYDLIALSGDRAAMVIGDVMGHGIAEAATMGRLRTAVHTLADLEMDPGELLSHLSVIVNDLGDDYYATCSYAVFDPVTRICSLSLAGQPPPMVVHPDGTVHWPDLAVNPPLGAAEPPFDVQELHLPEESLLVFCTNGLVESATTDFDQGLVQLRQTLAKSVARVSFLSARSPDDGAGRLEHLCDEVMSALLPDEEQTNDDAALLIACTRGTPVGNIASFDLPEDPRAAGRAREHVRAQLSDWGLDELTMTTELLASELVGNVIRHARGPARLRLLLSRSLICEVYDGSLTTPRIRRAGYTDEGGRGLQLVSALSSRWGARFLRDGKCIWTEQAIPHRTA
ncbi:SpoIIE family protein phosphatase [Streptomyces sp. NPDC091215]|uniref:ATP-binding SpoIIE family protein phosphatase n=1 Tax=Streptomyces sp. NPDC091215 TaxID=3155192 RepID=UPI0034380490